MANTLDAIKRDEETRNKNNSNQVEKKTTNFNPKDYLNTKLGKNEDEKTIRFRPLPIDQDSVLPYKRVFTHNMNVDESLAVSGYKSYICLNMTEGIDNEKYGKKCPICEHRFEAYKKSLEATDEMTKKTLQKESLSCIPNETIIMRGIDRDNEQDGPKFLKFNLRSDGLDVWSQMKRIADTRNNESVSEGDGEYDIFDINNGKDFNLTIKRVIDKNGNKTDKTSISVSDCSKPKPVSTNPEQLETWLKGEKQWYEVFAIKTYEYLKILLDGGIPFFDREKELWVPKKTREDYEKEKEENLNKAEEEIKTAEATINTQSSNTEKELPF